MLVVSQIRFPRLVHQHLREGRSRRERVEHELPLFLVFGGLADGDVCLGKMVAPFLVQLHELFKFSLEIVRRRVGIFFRIGIGAIIRRILSAFGGVGRRGRVARFAHVFHRFVRQFQFRRRDFLEDRVLLKLLFDESFEFKGRRLQQRQRLLELRRKHH